MNLAEFEDCIDRLGTALDGWPAEARAGAEALLAASAEARRLLGLARGLDSLFAVETCPPPPAVAVILARATAPRPSALARLTALLFPGVGGPVWLPAASLGACLVLGVVLGSGLAPRRDGISLSLLNFAVGEQRGTGTQLDAVDE
jgi:hypothetical protein